MKYLLIFAIILNYGCKDAYPSEQETPIVVTKYDTTSDPYLIADTDYRVIYPPCTGKVKKPYSLIQWNDGTYGILFKDEDEYAYKYKVVRGKQHLDFSSAIEEGEHFKDSCEAKENLQQFLNSRITYKIVK